MNKKELEALTYRRLLFVISGPSGAGKSTVAKKIAVHPAVADTIELSVSATTRAPRPGEKNGRDYRFISVQTFLEMRSGGGFLEWAKVHNAFYGTPGTNLEEAFSRGLDLLLEIDVQGGLQVKEEYPDAVMIFVAAPEAELRRRLSKRPSNLTGEKLEAEISLRLSNAIGELKKIPEYDYLVINENLDECINSVISIMLAERLRVSVEIQPGYSGGDK